MILVEAGPRLLPAFAPELAEKAFRELERIGVEVRLNSAVEAIDADGVTIAGRRIASRTVIWAAGVRGAGMCGLLGSERDRQGRIVVQPDLTVPGHPEIFVAGDAASIRQGDMILPGVAPVAIQSGRYAGQSILRRLQGRPPLPPFVYHDKGNMATIGRTFAIMESDRGADQRAPCKARLGLSPHLVPDAERGPADSFHEVGLALFHPHAGDASHRTG